ncbi:hypothetical protein APS56_03160 [Pseudalgibacter alginicilyticus]|uniref:Uncharacterized protein n=1 Tax=Pseudalgibacter alginicilyticus TaxID=1736674 RepID=A0A0P0CII4_9FLAO|nr:hypothetical protein [Pseudalgibacter alginicilyticus]ALJ04205.1 hypothetical protein APS56_03160 [Pseudalgibacter alginicilyticus]
MFTGYITLFFLKLSLFNQNQIVIGLSIVVGFFLILLILGVRKSFLLKKENDRLNKISEQQAEDDKNKTYKDFTEGHMYSNK